MIAFDTNLLVYAHRSENPWHSGAKKALLEAAEGQSPWAVPWPCIHEFLNIVTNARIFKKPTPLRTALQFVRDIAGSPQLHLLAEEEGYFETLTEIAQIGKVRGPLIHDARIAALCILHGVTLLYSADRDFGRFPKLKVHNPLLGR